MSALISSIQLDEHLKQRVIDLVNKDKVKILSLAEKCNNGHFECLAAKSDLTRLAVMLECADVTYEKYKKLGIDDSVFFATLDDIRIWCENNDNRGLKEYDWIKNHISFELFRIGRLQFQLYTCNNRTLRYSLLPFNYGERLIYVHIPQGEKLLYSDCVNSFKSANEFFGKYFPDYNYRYFFCESWLLYEGNQQFMESECNILKFASLFDIAYCVDLDFQAIERIFGKRRLDKSKYPENTSLQRNAKAHLINGGKLGIGIGVIDANDF